MTQTQKRHKNPPLAKAIRSFVTGMELPPPNHTDSNYKYAALISAMLQFSGHLKEDSDRAFCTPSQPQLAAYMHCDERTIRRILKELVDIGKIVVHQRQHNSNQYIIFKTFAAYKGYQEQAIQQSILDIQSGQNDPQSVQSDNESRVDTPPVQGGHLVSSIGVNTVGETAISRKTLKNRNHGGDKHGGKRDSQHDSKGNGMASAKGLAKVVSDTKTLPSNAAMTLCRLICRQQGTKPLNNEALKLEAAVNDYRLADYSNAIEWASDHDFWKDWLTVDYVAKKYAKLMADYVKDGGHISDVLSAEEEEWYGDQ